MKEAKLKAELADVSASRDDLWALWQAAIDLCLKNTTATAAYVAKVSYADVEEPAVDPAPEVPEGEEPPPPEDFPMPLGPEDEVPEDPEKPFDEPEPEPVVEGEEGAEEAEAAPAEETAAEGEAEPQEPPPIPTFDYSAAFLEYVVLSQGQEGWAKGDLDGARKVVRAGEPDPSAEEGTPAPKNPVMFRLLDEQLKHLYFPNALLENSLSFYRGLPRVGAYHASALATRPNQIQGIMCVDTVHLGKVAGTDKGREFTGEEQTYIARVADAATEAMLAMLDAKDEALETDISKENRLALQVSQAKEQFRGTISHEGS